MTNKKIISRSSPYTTIEESVSCTDTQLVTGSSPARGATKSEGQPNRWYFFLRLRHRDGYVSIQALIGSLNASIVHPLGVCAVVNTAAGSCHHLQWQALQFCRSWIVVIRDHHREKPKSWLSDTQECKSQEQSIASSFL